MVNNDIENVEKVFHPRKFIIWLLIISSIMAFAALCSAYIVMRNDDNSNWVTFDLPRIFLWSTSVVFLSSATIHYAYDQAKKQNIVNSKIAILVTLLLGVVFTYLQYLGLFVDLRGDGHYFLGKMSTVSSTFVYIFALLHILHLLLAMLVLIILTIKSFTGKLFDRNIITFHNGVVFWHFLGVLWVFLYLFLYFSR